MRFFRLVNMVMREQEWPMMIKDEVHECQMCEVEMHARRMGVLALLWPHLSVEHQSAMAGEFGLSPSQLIREIGEHIGIDESVTDEDLPMVFEERRQEHLARCYFQDGANREGDCYE